MVPAAVRVIRAGEGPRVRSEHADFSATDLGPGDYATFPGDAPHRYEALAPGTFAVLVAEHP
ncbi:hypothetical protein [Micromonospora kangleipakensis]|uniref:hypothetical protein n=1 Tax=Micromonospora kangleipakensis TaxID=1077942 RepID=UPI001F5E6AE0|nr:hypothetical protein [Micromonospora kangleipakensis]